MRELTQTFIIRVSVVTRLCGDGKVRKTQKYLLISISHHPSPAPTTEPFWTGLLTTVDCYKPQTGQ